MSDNTVQEVTKNSREVIRIKREEFNGHDLVNVRVFYLDQISGEMKPGKQGVAFRAALLPDVLTALKSVGGKEGA